MTDNSSFGFGKFVPGFDFLQSIAKGASQTLPQMPNLSNWIAPTLDVEELEKRIGELKAVHFWLDQNSKALAATVQALEVQKMTLATLKGMNFNMGDVANAFKLKGAGTAPGAVQNVSETPAAAAEKPKSAPTKSPSKSTSGKAGASAVVDPLQWWGALTQQFQQIATDAMKDAASQAAMHTPKHIASGAAKPAKGAARKTARKRASKKTR